MKASSWRFVSARGGEKDKGLCGSDRIFVSDAETSFEAAEDDKSPGTMLLKCVPYNDPGPSYWGTVQFGKGCFEASLAAIEAKEEKAYIFADSHMGRPESILANSKNKGVRANVTFDDRDDGLYARVVLPDTSAGRDVAELVEQGAIDSCSVGVLIQEYTSRSRDDDSYDEDMTITAAVLEETSLVAFPRFENTEVEMTSEKEAVVSDETKARFEAIVREAVSETVSEVLAEAIGEVIDATASEESEVDVEVREDAAEIINISNWRSHREVAPVVSWRSQLNTIKEAI